MARRSTVAASTTAVLTLVMPKCPLCAAALLAALGIEARWLGAMMGALLAASVVLIVVRRSPAWVVALAVVGAGVAIVARLVSPLPLLFHAGVALLVLAAIAGGRRPSCSPCETATAAQPR